MRGCGSWYFPEVEALLRAHVPGAAHPDARVLIHDHVLRSKARISARGQGADIAALR
eukprot:gene5182-22543_t